MSDFNSQTNLANSTAQYKPKPKTITIDARYKELYCQSIQPIVQETNETLQHNHALWSYMMNISMQNSIVQINKAAALRA